jgi:4-methylaminobutanoate oxidase (formaldehyde-forming)
LLHVLLEDPGAMLFHAEGVSRDGVEVGYLRSASYGHTLGGAVGLAMVDGHGAAVDAAWVAAGRWSVQVGNVHVPARVSLSPLYDPQGARIRG